MLALWIVLCALLNCAGWILSALHQLNRAGYGCVFLLGAIGVCVFYKGEILTVIPNRGTLQKFKCRFKRTFPLAFFILALMAIAGGVIYPPSNYDALAYRIPRVLHWLAEGRWHWIHTEFGRLNTRATGFEWLSTPIILFTKTDRFVFVINVISFLFLPGLVFSVFTRLGVRSRVAWHWMWIVPTGYCFLLQAGSVANDMFGAVFALAALDFALRSRTSSHGCAAVWWSVLAAALLTNSKSSNIPLLLPWLLAVFPAAFSGIKTRPFSAACITLIAALSSLLPISVLNVKYCGDWTGSVMENAAFGGDPWVCFSGNSALLPFQNLTPPIFPFAHAWNQNVHKLIPVRWGKSLEKNFETSGGHFQVGEMVIEEDAGLGFGVTILLLVGVVAACRTSPQDRQRNRPENPFEHAIRILILVSPYVGLFVFATKSGLSGGSRIIAPYYPLLMPLLLIRDSHSRLIKKRWWKRLAMVVVFILAGILMIVQPARPFWPANYILPNIGRNDPASPLLARASAVYSTYRNRANAFAPVLDILPPDADVLGIVSFDDPETSLWRPFGNRRIFHVIPQDSVEDLERCHIKYVLVGMNHFLSSFNQPFDQWLESHHGVVLKKIPLTLKVHHGVTDWFLVEIQPDQGKTLTRIFSIPAKPEPKV